MLRTLNTSIRKKREDQGFTLIELLVVILIIGILAAIVVVAIRGTTGDASANACNQNAANLANAIDRYLADNNDTIDDPTTPLTVALVESTTVVYSPIEGYTKAQLEALLVPNYIKSIPDPVASASNKFPVVGVKATRPDDVVVYGAACLGVGGKNAGL